MPLRGLPPSRRVWIFDLDNTLHDCRPGIFPAMHEQMNAYLRRRFDLDEAGANALRRDFWRRYGTTLKGLMRHYGEDPKVFLRETHDFPELAGLVEHENALRHAFARLGGRKLLFSNAPRHYVDGVLRAIGVRRWFDAVYTIEDSRYVGKPSFRSFHVLLRTRDLDPRRCVMIDDMLENLRAAKRLGMATVWISRESRRVPYVDLRVVSVLELPRRFLR